MIIVSIFGGLGNQMFQYALGRHLSHKLNTEFKMDYSYNLVRTDFNPDDILSIFDIFNLKGVKATIEEINKFKSLNQNLSFKKVWYHVKNRYPNLLQTKYRTVNESYFHFNPEILDLPNNCYLSGYWQSEKYFTDDEVLIREDFKILEPTDEKNLDIAEKIKNSESVSIHLRGRDYITRNDTNRQHFTCDNSYYERSIHLIIDKVLNPHFFIFSDDPKWAKSFLKINYPFTFVEGNSWNKTSYEDLRLMSLCKHNIIANSSFSWWASWLNQNPDKIIIAPGKWFNDPLKNTDDLIPENWIRI